MITRTALWALAAVCLALLLTSCQKNSCCLEPTICYTAPKRLISHLPSPFPSLSTAERATEWGKELDIANHFARETDYYRAITAYKRARFLIPRETTERRQQIDYGIILAYYLGGKYQDAVEAFEVSDLAAAGPAFPAFGDLLVLLYDAYSQDCRIDRAEAVLELIHKHSEETADDLELYQSVVDGDVCDAMDRAERHPNCMTLLPHLEDYCSCALSVRKAQTLNAILPGAGYYYVGQRQSAFTSFLLNTLFTAAAVYFFDNGNIPMGVILTSLETGWYFGGINGAGLAAKEYNERLFEQSGRELLMENRLFPVLMFEFSF